MFLSSIVIRWNSFYEQNSDIYLSSTPMIFTLKYAVEGTISFIIWTQNLEWYKTLLWYRWTRQWFCFRRYLSSMKKVCRISWYLSMFESMTFESMNPTNWRKFLFVLVWVTSSFWILCMTAYTVSVILFKVKRLCPRP